MLLTIPEVAERLRLSKARVYVRISNGEIAVVRAASGRMRIEESELVDYIRRNTVKAKK